jgi:Cof subfamily protein (haloacid dehalogenase superfamily)
MVIPRLLAIDIDGTLLNSRFQISPENIAALRGAHEKGVEIVLVTGRRHSFALPIAQQLGFDLWLISSNGAITKSLQGETFHRDLLPAEIARRLCRELPDFTGNLVLTFDREDKGALVLESFDAFAGSVFGWIEKNRAYIDCVQPIEHCITCDPIQAMYCGGFERMRVVHEALAASSVAREITLLRTEYPARDLAIADIVNVGCSKGAALARWTRHRGIAPADVMAIGDNHNDRDMLEFAGLPVLMGNATEELRSLGWHVTATHDEHGVAAAIQHFIG